MGWFDRQPDLRERDLAELQSLYARVRDRVFDADDVVRLIGAVYTVLDPDLARPMATALEKLIEEEQLTGTPPDFATLDFRQQASWRSRLKALDLKLADDTGKDLLANLFASLAVQLPKTRAPSPFTVPLIHTLQNPREWISSLYKTLWEGQYLDRDILATLRNQMYLNLCYVSGIEPFKETKKPFKHAFESDLSLDRLNDTYLEKTPLHELFTTPVPLRLTHEDRYNHMHIVGGTGAGKTTLIENLILHDIRSEDPPSLVVIDPHGDLIRKLTHADLGIEDRLIIIDPRDIKHPPALNVFALNQQRLGGYDDATREQVTAGVIQTFDYLFSGLIGADLTAKQGVFFRYVTRLMLALPETLGRNATILDMLRLMSDPAPYRAAIDSLPDIPRDFFLNDFQSKTFQQTKEQIRYRLQAILENPTMARLFTSPETKVDLFDALNSGKIVVVDTAKDFLKGASDNFGRIFISLVLQAVLERSALPAGERKPTFLIVDEAASYFDSNIDDLLTEARKYRCGIVLAHQYLDQASSSLKASLAANTGAKFASGLSSGDARTMAPDMRTTADFILAQPKLQFAAHIRGVTPHAVSIPVTPGVLDNEPRLSAEAFARLMDRNRAQVSLGQTTNRSPPPVREAVPVSPQTPEIADDEW